MQALTRRNHPLAAEVANDATPVGRVHHRQSSHVVTDHLGDGIMQQLVGVGDDRVAAARIEHCCGMVIPAFDGADQGAVLRWLDTQDAVTQKRLFVDWKPFDHPQLGEVLLGGFVSHEQQNQTLPALRPLAERCTEFTRALADWAPRVAFEEVSSESMGGDVFRIRARLANRGRLPTNLTAPGRTLRCIPPLEIRFHASDGVELLSQTGHTTVGHLAAVTGNRPLEWFVRCTKKKADVALEIPAGPWGTTSCSVALG